MAAPQIDTRTSLRILNKGEEIDFTPVAINEPTEWSLSPIPEGLTFNYETGHLGGNVTKAGLHQLILRAINEDGFDEIVLLLPVLETGSTIGQNDITLEMNVDVLTGKVTFLGTEGASWGPPTQTFRNDGLRAPLLLVKKGDRFPVAIGFTRNGVLQDLPIDRLRFGSKEFTTDGLLPLTDGTFRPIGQGSTRRYVVTLVVGDNLWRGALSNYEDETGTYVDSHSEVQFSLIRAFGHDAVEQEDEKDFTAPVTSSHTFSFEDLPPDNGTYTLVLSITKEGGTTTTLTKLYDLVYSGGTFAVRDQDDPITHFDRYDITYQFSCEITLDTVSIPSGATANSPTPKESGSYFTGTRGMIFLVYDTAGVYVDHLPVGSHASGIWPFLPGNATYRRGSNNPTWNGTSFDLNWSNTGFWASDNLWYVAHDFERLMGYVTGWTYTAERVSSSVLRLVGTRKVRSNSPTIDPNVTKPPRAGKLRRWDNVDYAFTGISTNVVVVPAAPPSPTNVLLNYSSGGLTASTRITSAVANGLDLKVNLQTIASVAGGGGSGSDVEEIPFTVTGVLTTPEKTHDAFVKTSETFILRASGDMIEEDNQDL